MKKNNDKKILNISLEFSFITIKQNSAIKIIKKDCKWHISFIFQACFLTLLEINYNMINYNNHIDNYIDDISIS